MPQLLEPFVRMLESACPPLTVRAVEQGDDAAPLWSVLNESGFLDALMLEVAGGAALPLSDVAPLWLALGGFAAPLPIAETMVARHLLALAGMTPPTEPITLATASDREMVAVCHGRHATHVLTDFGDRLVLAAAPEARPTGVRGDLAAFMDAGALARGSEVPRPHGGLRPIAALIGAAGIAGAGARLLAMTVEHANQRIQFGKPIGRQQAIQQQLAVMAEDIVATRIAVEGACSGGLPLRLASVATAKIIAGQAAPRIANTAHAVFGAIGIAEEHDLQLFTRRLQAWRLADGSEGWWSRQLGELRLVSADNSVDWVRTEVFCSAA